MALRTISCLTLFAVALAGAGSGGCKDDRDARLKEVYADRKRTFEELQPDHAHPRLYSNKFKDCELRNTDPEEQRRVLVERLPLSKRCTLEPLYLEAEAGACPTSYDVIVKWAAPVLLEDAGMAEVAPTRLELRDVPNTGGRVMLTPPPFDCPGPQYASTVWLAPPGAAVP